MPSLLAADMEAINKFMMESDVKTSKAESIKQDWIRYWSSVQRDWTWYSQEEYDKARNYRNQFNIANAVSKQEQAAVKQAIKSGVTSEEAQGETRRAGTEGSYIVEPDPIINIPTSWKIAGIVGTLGIALAWAASKVLYFDPVKISANALFSKRKP